MTPAELDEIEKRAKKATEGPWVYRERKVMAPNSPNDQGDPGLVAQDVYGNDEAFIAHARSDIPKLIEEVRRLNTQQESLREMWRAAYVLARVDGWKLNEQSQESRLYSAVMDCAEFMAEEGGEPEP